MKMPEPSIHQKALAANAHMLERLPPILLALLVLGAFEILRIWSDLPIPLAPAAYAQTAGGGALPKGDVKALDASKASGPKPSTAINRSVPACVRDLIDPPGGRLVFNPDGKSLWLLAPTLTPSSDPKAKAKATARHPSGDRKLTLFKVNLTTRMAEAILALDDRPDVALVTQGAPALGISTLAFTGDSAPCLAGQATIVNISFAKKAERAVQVRGSFYLTGTPGGLLLVDQTKGQILETDLNTFQSKGRRKLPKNERALYFDPTTELLVTWYDDGTRRGLVRYDGGKAPQRLEFRPQDRLLQSWDRFAAVRMENARNRLRLTELFSNLGGKAAKEFSVALPLAYPVAGADIVADVARQRLLVNGGSPMTRRGWQKAFVFDGTSSKPVATIEVSGQNYIEAVDLDPTGAIAVAEVRDGRNQTTSGLKLYDFGSKSLIDLPLLPIRKK